jgi:hypothetical protein
MLEPLEVLDGLDLLEGLEPLELDDGLEPELLELEGLEPLDELDGVEPLDEREGGNDEPVLDRQRLESLPSLELPSLDVLEPKLDVLELVELRSASTERAALACWAAGSDEPERVSEMLDSASEIDPPLAIWSRYTHSSRYFCVSVMPAFSSRASVRVMRAS